MKTHKETFYMDFSNERLIEKGNNLSCYLVTDSDGKEYVMKMNPSDMEREWLENNMDHAPHIVASYTECVVMEKLSDDGLDRNHQLVADLHNDYIKMQCGKEYHEVKKKNSYKDFGALVAMIRDVNSVNNSKKHREINQVGFEWALEKIVEYDKDTFVPIHGDFLDKNILIDSYGDYKLIDPLVCYAPPIVDIARYISWTSRGETTLEDKVKFFAEECFYDYDELFDWVSIFVTLAYDETQQYRVENYNELCED